MKYLVRNIAYLFVFALISCATGAGTHDDFFRAARSDNAGAIRDLIARGFDPNTRDEHNQTALLIALREPSPKVIQALLDSPRTDVEARNSKDESPLMLAAIKGQQDVVVKLLARDADVNKTGWTPLHYAATSGQIAIMKLLLDKYAFIDAQSPNGTTPLMMAAMYGSSDSVKLLLDEGADPMMKNEQGLTAVDFARRANREGDAAMINAAMQKKPPREGKW
jgi:ankyrin repeat protein